MQLHLPDGTVVDMFRIGGMWKYASACQVHDSLEAAYATRTGGKATDQRRVISHGCAPHMEKGVQASLGYWKTALNNEPTNGWTTIGVSPYVFFTVRLLQRDRRPHARRGHAGRGERATKGDEARS